MSCQEYKDNRETCGQLTSSSCVAYMGYIADWIKDDLQCKPNINDMFKVFQDKYGLFISQFGDITTLDIKCLRDTLIGEITQSSINQYFVDEMCELKRLIRVSEVDANELKINVNLLCLEDEGCEQKTEYLITEEITKLVTKYCDLLERVKTIEELLNI